MGRHSDNSLQESRNHATLLSSSTNTIDLLHKSNRPPFIPPYKATVYTQVELPPSIPPYKGGKPEI